MGLFACYSRVDIPRDLVNFDRKELHTRYFRMVSDSSHESSRLTCENLINVCSLKNLKTLINLGSFGLFNPKLTVTHKTNILQMFVVMTKIRDYNCDLVNKSGIIGALYKYALVLKTGRPYCFDTKIPISNVKKFSEYVVHVLDEWSNYNSYGHLIEEGIPRGVRRLCETSKRIKSKLLKKGVKFTVATWDMPYHRNDSLNTLGGSNEIVLARTFSFKFRELQSNINSMEEQIASFGLFESESSVDELIISDLISSLSLFEFKAQNLVQESVESENMRNYDEIMNSLEHIKNLINTLKTRMCISIDPTYVDNPPELSEVEPLPDPTQLAQLNESQQAAAESSDVSTQLMDDYQNEWEGGEQGIYTPGNDSVEAEIEDQGFNESLRVTVSSSELKDAFQSLSKDFDDLLQKQSEIGSEKEFEDLDSSESNEISTLNSKNLNKTDLNTSMISTVDELVVIQQSIQTEEYKSDKDNEEEDVQDDLEDEFDKDEDDDEEDAFSDKKDEELFEVQHQSSSFDSFQTGFAVNEDDEIGNKLEPTEFFKETWEKPNLSFEETSEKFEKLDDKEVEIKEDTETLRESNEVFAKDSEHSQEKMKDKGVVSNEVDEEELYRDISYVMETLKRINNYLESKPPKFVVNSKNYQSLSSSSALFDGSLNEVCESVKQSNSPGLSRPLSGEDGTKECQLLKKDELPTNEIDRNLYLRLNNMYTPSELRDKMDKLSGRNSVTHTSTYTGDSTQRVEPVNGTDSVRTTESRERRGPNLFPNVLPYDNSLLTSTITYTHPKPHHQSHFNLQNAQTHKRMERTQSLPECVNNQNSHLIQDNPSLTLHNSLYQGPRVPFTSITSSGIFGRLKKDEKGVCNTNVVNRNIYHKGIPSEGFEKMMNQTQKMSDDTLFFRGDHGESLESFGMGHETINVYDFGNNEDYQSQINKNNFDRFSTSTSELNDHEKVVEFSEIKVDNKMEQSREDNQNVNEYGYPVMDLSNIENVSNQNGSEKVENEDFEVGTESKVEDEDNYHKVYYNNYKNQVTHREESYTSDPENLTNEEAEFQDYNTQMSYSQGFEPQFETNKTQKVQEYDTLSQSEPDQFMTYKKYKSHKSRDSHKLERTQKLRRSRRQSKYYRRQTSSTSSTPSRVHNKHSRHGQRSGDRSYEYDWEYEDRNKKQREYYQYPETSNYPQFHHHTSRLNRETPRPDIEIESLNSSLYNCQSCESYGGYHTEDRYMKTYPSAYYYHPNYPRYYPETFTQRTHQMDPRRQRYRTGKYVKINDKNQIYKNYLIQESFNSSVNEHSSNFDSTPIHSTPQINISPNDKLSEDESISNVAINNSDPSEIITPNTEFEDTFNKNDSNTFKTTKVTHDEVDDKVNFKDLDKKDTERQSTDSVHKRDSNKCKVGTQKDGQVTNSQMVKQVIKFGGDVIYEDKFINVRYNHFNRYDPYPYLENTLSIHNNSIYSFSVSFDYSNFENFPINLKFLNKQFTGLELHPNSKVCHYFSSHCYGPFIGLPKLVLTCHLDVKTDQVYHIYLPMSISCFFLPTLDLYNISQNYFVSDKFKHIMKNKVYFSVEKTMGLNRALDVIKDFGKFKILQTHNNHYYLASTFSAPFYFNCAEMYKFTIFAMVEVGNRHYNVHVSSDSYRLANSVSMLFKYILQN